MTHERAIREKNPSDLLAIFHMKKLDNSYRDNVVIGQGAGAVNLQVNLYTGERPPVRPPENLLIESSDSSDHGIDLGPGRGEN